MADKTLQLPSSVVGWIYNHSRKNYWRLASWYEVDDLIQDGLMFGYKCLNRYGVPGIDIDPPHFMRLVQTSFRNHIGELIRNKYKRGDDVTVGLADLRRDKTEEQILELVSQPAECLQDFAVLIAELPEQLRKAVMLFFSDKGARQLRRVKLNSDETVAEKLAKATGFPIDKDFEEELRSYIWERDAELI